MVNLYNFCIHVLIILYMHGSDVFLADTASSVDGNDHTKSCDFKVFITVLLIHTSYIIMLLWLCVYKCLVKKYTLKFIRNKLLYYK